MSSNPRYTEEFKVEAIKQITERHHSVDDVAERLGVSTHSLYKWLKYYSAQSGSPAQLNDQQAEIRQLKAELKRVTEDRDILKKPPAYFAKQPGLGTHLSKPIKACTAYVAYVK